METNGIEGAGVPPSNIPEALIVMHHSMLSVVEREEEQANNTLKAIRKRKSKMRKTIQADGIKLKNFDAARTMLLADDEDDVRADLVEQGRILRAFKCPLGLQFDLFDEPDREALEDQWFASGYRSGACALDFDKNPHRPGDDGYVLWQQGYKAAQALIAAGIEMTNAPVPTLEQQSEDDGQTDIEDHLEENAAIAAPSSEDEALSIQ